VHPDDLHLFLSPKFILFPTAARFEGGALHANQCLPWMFKPQSGPWL
jgi:hypothetical protein